MTFYKLTYFNIAGMAEGIRYILAYSGEKFEDLRISRNEWETLKSKTPTGTLPVFEFDNTTATQSLAICRYLGKKFNIAGDNDLDQLMIDNLADDLNDYRVSCLNYVKESNPEAKALKLTELKTVSTPALLERFEKLANQNNGYIALKKLSWFDLVMVGTMDMIALNVFYDRTYDFLSKYPALIALRERISGLPGIKDYLQNRPPSD